MLAGLSRRGTRQPLTLPPDSQHPMKWCQPNESSLHPVCQGSKVSISANMSISWTCGSLSHVFSTFLEGAKAIFAQFSKYVDFGGPLHKNGLQQKDFLSDFLWWVCSMLYSIFKPVGCAVSEPWFKKKKDHFRKFTSGFSEVKGQHIRR